MPANFKIESGFIAEQNSASTAALAEDLDFLGRKLERRGIDIEAIIEKARGLRVAVPSWGLGTGGTRFARFPGPGEPRNIYEKLEDCATINDLVRTTPAVSLQRASISRWGPSVFLAAIKIAASSVSIRTFFSRPFSLATCSSSKFKVDFIVTSRRF